MTNIILDTYPQTCSPSAFPGTPGNLTKEQEETLLQFRSILLKRNCKERLDDSTLLRFLRARKFNINASVEMFVETERWREEYGANTIIEDYENNKETEDKERIKLAKMYPQYYHHVDKDGRPLYFEELGGINLNKMYKITTEEHMLRNLVKEYELFARYRVPACSRRAGYLIETSCTVLDLKGISLSNAYHVLSYIKDVADISQNYYPERIGKFYIIHSPFGFSTMFKLVKPFLDPVTVSKIFILGSSYKKELLKQIPIENLPIKYGGTSTLHNPNDRFYYSDIGPWRDPEYIGPEGEIPNIFGKFTVTN
ncbi:phosphatidylinositol/phosphatidylcholine-binding protein SKDI_11G1240 [Saccharomyces kudriavzevii IFO 1802]|uniref:YKL091C-like protein n=2 Tax=Saccharomyces kudriavzevii (strain ATCC MYA-4449 / AS 2.2408 / CBS 8840 / NBRC 1802 / NCYC 2889) TaxID=226230 RepID=J6ECU7_SACK1|nr:uncharacterized protein SKDI_11G1240 [Saccharomyces kudriavzevii IFO 1802]EJT42104.1 YKL091C-like protein [Saccharomyces kudriavzevii IFO 1802]CAI4044698.1 hypothetical protein SKDI_11G1240 [Saccharomyces kudriavzevii IFO 1802]